MKQLFTLFILALSLTSYSQDRLFTYTYQSNVLNKGQKELEIWTTMRNQRQNYFRAFDHRMEFEVGLGKKLQTAFYLNYSYSTAINKANGIESVSRSTGYSFANEWKLKLTDPVVNPIGSALYFEYYLAPEEIELEGKLILDKRTGKLLQAFNLVGEYEFENELKESIGLVEIDKERELKIILFYGLSYQINKNISCGIEIMNKNKFQNQSHKYSVLAAGPVIAYSTDNFWANLTFMPQFTDVKTGNLELVKNEKFQARLIFSYVL